MSSVKDIIQKGVPAAVGTVLPRHMVSQLEKMPWQASVTGTAPRPKLMVVKAVWPAP